MLYAIRERATGWIAYLIILVISIPFALWGISEYFGFGGEVEVAEVNGEPISIERYNQLYRFNRQENSPPSGVDAEQWDRRLKEQVLDGLINQELLFQYLDRQGLDVTDVEVAQSIQEMDLFQIDGFFSEKHYRRILEVNRTTPTQFETDRRQEMRTEIVQQLMEESALVIDAEVREFRVMQDQSRDVRYFEVPQDRFVDLEAVTDEEVKAAYERSSGQYMTPERVKVSYLELRLGSLDEEGAEMEEEALKTYHEKHVLDFMEPELRKLRQVFLKPTESLERAQALYKRFQGGEDFADLAREHSQDELSRERGGGVGWVALEDLPEDLGSFVFSLEAGKVSEPVSTKRGFYLLDVEEIKPARLKPFEDVRDQVTEQVRRVELKKRYAVAAEELDLLAFENPENLTLVEEKLGLEVKTTELIPLGELPEGVLSRPEVLSVLRQRDVLHEGVNSNRIDLEVDWSVVVRVDEYEESQPIPLEEVKDQIRENLARQAAREKLLMHMPKLVEQFQENPDMEVLAEQEEVELVVQEKVIRNSAHVPRAILEKIFSMSRPVDESPSVGTAISFNSMALVVLDAVHEAMPDEVQEEDRESLREQAKRSEIGAFRALLMAQAEIVRYLDRLE